MILVRPATKDEVKALIVSHRIKSCELDPHLNLAAKGMFK